MPEQWISGNRSMDSGRRPLCGCFVLSCMVGGIFRKPLGFRRCLPPARPEKALPFQAGQSPCTKHPQIVRLCLYAPKKFLRVPRGVFSKTHPWQGVGQRPTKGDTNTFKGDNRQSRESYEILTKALPNHGRRKKRILLYCRRNKDNEERLRKKVEK